MKANFLKKWILLSVSLLALNMARAESNQEGCVIAGPSDAPQTIEEYSDLECVYCARGALLMKQALRDYPGKIKLVLRNLPLPMHEYANVAAKAFTAVWLQKPDRAYDFQEQIFMNQSRLSSEGETFLLELAKKLGVDEVQMKADMESDKVDKIIKRDLALADKYGFKGTPSFRVGSESVHGAIPYNEMRAVVDRQLKK